MTNQHSELSEAVALARETLSCWEGGILAAEGMDEPNEVTLARGCVGLFEQLGAARSHPQPEELREAWEAIKSDMSREAFVPWAEGMIRTLDALQEQLETQRDLLRRIYENERVWRVLPTSIGAELFSAVESEGDHDAGHSAQAGQTASVAPSESIFEELRQIESAARAFLTACDEQGCSDAPMDEFCGLVEAVSRLPGPDSFRVKEPS